MAVGAVNVGFVATGIVVVTAAFWPQNKRMAIVGAAGAVDIDFGCTTAISQGKKAGQDQNGNDFFHTGMVLVRRNRIQICAKQTFSGMTPTLKTETLRLEQLTTSRVLGICYLDAQGRLMQVFDLDESFRNVLVDYQKERIAQLTRSDRAADNLKSLLAYPVQED